MKVFIIFLISVSILLSSICIPLAYMEYYLDKEWNYVELEINDTNNTTAFNIDHQNWQKAHDLWSDSCHKEWLSIWVGC